MMVRACLAALGLAGLAACSPAIPDSGPGFEDYESYAARRAARDAALEAPVTVRPPAEAPATPLDAARAALADPAPSEAAADAEARARNSGEAPVQASPSNPPPATLNNPGLSDENDFEAVSGRRGIESDAERLARAQAQYQVIEPQALPERRGATEPNIVAYALETSHPVGTRVWSRSGINAEARFRRNCAAYASPDLAQADFLARGGPERDPRGLDPDGDGYACGWNPAPFRAAVRG